MVIGVYVIYLSHTTSTVFSFCVDCIKVRCNYLRLSSLVLLFFDDISDKYYSVL